MNGIQSFGRNLAMDGHTHSSSLSTLRREAVRVRLPVPDTSDVVDSLAENRAKARLNVQELQRIADATGRKLRFNVNKELGQVIVKIVDPSTDKVVREIPSVGMQEAQITIRQTIGMFFDERV